MPPASAAAPRATWRAIAAAALGLVGAAPAARVGWVCGACRIAFLADWRAPRCPVCGRGGRDG